MYFVYDQIIHTLHSAMKVEYIKLVITCVVWNEYLIYIRYVNFICRFYLANKIKGKTRVCHDMYFDEWIWTELLHSISVRYQYTFNVFISNLFVVIRIHLNVLLQNSCSSFELGKLFKSIRYWCLEISYNL